MARLDQHIALHDGMSPVMGKITGLTDRLLQRLEKMTYAARQVDRISQTYEHRFAPALQNTGNAALGATARIEALQAATQHAGITGLSAMTPGITALSRMGLAASPGIAALGNMSMAAARASGHLLRMERVGRRAAGGVATEATKAAGALRDLQAEALAKDHLDSMSLPSVRPQDLSAMVDDAMRGTSLPKTARAPTPMVISVQPDMGAVLVESNEVTRRLRGMRKAAQDANQALDYSKIPPLIRPVGAATADASAAMDRLSRSASSGSAAVAGTAHAAGSMPPVFGASAAAANVTAGSVGRIGAAAMAARGGVMALGMSVSAAFGLFSMIAGAVYGIYQMISGTLGLSDAYSQITARLGLMNDGLQTTAELEDKVFASAQRARSAYQDTANFVAKVGMQAKDAFKNNDEVILMAEQLNKIFKISGTGQQEQAAAMLQLTQALSSGVLRGEELNSVFEAAPMVIEQIADYLDKPIGSIRDMAAEGQITAEIVKNAMFASVDVVNEKYAQIPKTWGDAWTDFKNISEQGLKPLWAQLKDLANSPAVHSFIRGIAVGVAVLGTALAGVINNARWLAGVITDTLGYAFDWVSAAGTIGFTLIAESIPYVAGAVVGLATAWAILNSRLIANAFISAGVAAWQAILRAKALAVATAQSIWAAVTWALTVAQFALGVSLSFLAIPIVLIAILIGVAIAAFTAWMIKSYGLRNVMADVFEAIVDITQSGVNMVIRAINGMLKVINKAAEALNGIFGTNIGQVTMVEEVDFQANKKYWSGAIRDGSLGDKLLEKIKPPDLDSLGKAIPGAPVLGDIAAAGKDTAGNTKGIKDAMDITEEDLKYMRDIAEQEVINKYTTAEVKIDMGGVYNNVSSEMDLDGVTQRIGESLFESMSAGAEAVHS